MALDPMIARGVQPLEIGNTLMRIGAMQQRDESLAQDAKYQNALMADRQADRTQQQNALAEEEKKRRREAAEPMLAEALRSGDPTSRARALEMGRQFAIEVNPQLAQFPPEQLDQFIEKGLTEKYAKQFTPGQTRTRIVGGQQIQEEFDSATGKWSEIGRGSRFAPQQAPQPSAEERDRAWYLNATEEQRKLYDRMKGRDQGTKPTVAQSAVDKSFAPEYSKFVTGGAADAQKALDELRGVHAQLKGGKKNLTGPVLGRMPLEDRAMFNQDSVDAEETVANTVQRSLRVILGAQFTQKEGEALIRRAYNPQLNEEKNAERLGRLITQLDRALKAKQEAAQYYEQNGTLVGYQGKTDFSLSDFNADGDAYGGTGGWSIEEVP